MNLGDSSPLGLMQKSAGFAAAIAARYAFCFDTVLCDAVSVVWRCGITVPGTVGRGFARGGSVPFSGDESLRNEVFACALYFSSSDAERVNVLVEVEFEVEDVLFSYGAGTARGSRRATRCARMFMSQPRGECGIPPSPSACQAT